MAKCAIYQCNQPGHRELTMGNPGSGEFTDWYCAAHADQYEAKGLRAVGKVKSPTAAPTAAGHHQLSMEVDQ